MPPRNPADLVLRARYREAIHFPDLTERLALRLSSIVRYTARAHFGLWHRKVRAVPTSPIRRASSRRWSRSSSRRPTSRSTRGSRSRARRDVLAKTVDGTARSASWCARGGTRCATATGAVVARARLMQRLHALRSRTRRAGA